MPPTIEYQWNTSGLDASLRLPKINAQTLSCGWVTFSGVNMLPWVISTMQVILNLARCIEVGAGTSPHWVESLAEPRSSAISSYIEQPSKSCGLSQTNEQATLEGLEEQARQETQE
ncbi:hypothetical protein Y032_0031g2263 [Ancylostoma ceylanicum]|uniref:Uncharacterized protein n=1 Tax=Ancylostoma ceylanicum TaxID=53326 RepID=A0A016URH1_9BILA|nr:hypothetical protein Y032_0031g2263 [Ancylostoma ceylanicum]